MTGLLPSTARCLNNELSSGATCRHQALNHNSYADKSEDFKIELFPLHSPLLGESLLVSFPPLNNMLKFSGSSYLSSALEKAFVYHASA